LDILKIIKEMDLVCLYLEIKKKLIVVFGKIINNIV
jgi:hypothetical protein